MSVRDSLGVTLHSEPAVAGFPKQLSQPFPAHQVQQGFPEQKCPETHPFGSLFDCCLWYPRFIDYSFSYHADVLEHRSWFPLWWFVLNGEHRSGGGWLSEALGGQQTHSVGLVLAGD